MAKRKSIVIELSEIRRAAICLCLELEKDSGRVLSKNATAGLVELRKRLGLTPEIRQS